MRKGAARQLKVEGESDFFFSMKTSLLGNSDMRITRFGFGAWAAGGAWQYGWGTQDDSNSVAAIHRALELGINWIDTAAVYGLGHSEEVVAKALAAWSGPKPYVFTKCGMIWNEKREVDYSLKANSIRRECENSLRRLNTEVIDLYQIHWPSDNLSETQEGWTALAALQKEGKVRWIGASNFSREELQAAQAYRSDNVPAAALLTDPPRDRERCPALLQRTRNWRNRLLTDGFRTAHWHNDSRARRHACRGRLAQQELRISRAEAFRESLHRSAS